MNRVAAIILAAGFGSRLSADESHKLLTPVGSRTLLGHHLHNFACLGVEEVIVVTGYRGAELTEAVDDHEAPAALTVRCAHNRSFEGQNGISVLAGVEALSSPTQPFWLTMSDHLFDPALFDDLRRRFDNERDPRWQGALAIDTKLDTIFDMPDATKVRRGEDFAIGKQLQQFDAVDVGLFWCAQGFVEALRAEQGERGDCSTSDAVRRLQREERFGFWDIRDALWQDIDTPEAHRHAESLLARGFERRRGRADAAPTAPSGAK